MPIAQFLDAVLTLDPARIQRAARRQPRNAACPDSSPRPAAKRQSWPRSPPHGRSAPTAPRWSAHATSADVPTGGPGRTVGYAAVVLGRDLPASTDRQAAVVAGAGDRLTREEGMALVAYARETVTQYLESGTVPIARSEDPRLHARAGAFVTIRKRGELRGCVGQIADERPLLWTVGTVALRAAHDPRMPPVTSAELPSVAFEVSVLTRPRPIPRATDIVVGRDGVILEQSGRSAVFLPEVATEQGWSRDQLLDNLCEKAGLRSGCWRSGSARISVFQTQPFHEAAAR